MFKVRQVGKTLVNRTAGTKISSDSLKGRVYEVSLADLQSENDAERSFRKFSLVCEDVQGKNCLTNFHSMDLTTDKLRSMVKKWQTLIQTKAEVRTTDGYTLRFFAIGFTKKQDNSQKKTCYAKSEKVHRIRKVKVLKRPKYDLTKLLELHGDGGSGKTTVTKDPLTGELVERVEGGGGYEPPVLESV